MKLTLAHFLTTLSDYTTTGHEPDLSSVVMDSREAKPGSLFVAEKGEHVDGHDFVAAAFANGAVAALVERPLPITAVSATTIDLRQGPHPSGPVATPICIIVENSVHALQECAKAWWQQVNPTVVGITGSVGKTSTKELTHAVLNEQFRAFKSPGNRNSILGLPLAMFEIQPQHQVAVLEMAMYGPGEIARLCELAPPTIGVVTLIGAVHLERVGSMEGIVRAKRELVEALPADGIAILNKDDERVMSMADHTQARIFTYGLDPSADLWADNIRSMGLQGVQFTFHHQDDSLHLQVPMLGRHSVHISLRAAAVGLAMGMSWNHIARGLRRNQAELRLVAVPGPQESIIIDDTYNASPESVMAALNLLRDLDGRRVAVLGDMLELGYVEEALHRMVGRRVTEVAHVLVAVGQRGRWIGEEALAIGMKPTQVHFAEDAATAVALVENQIQPKDVILVKGSWGMRMDRIVAALGKDT